MTGLRFDASWLRTLRSQAEHPPLRPRVPLTWQGLTVGSVEPELLQGLAAPAHLRLCAGGDWELLGDADAALDAVARALRSAARVCAWRDEQLAVCDAAGTPVASVERGVVRLLGIATRAVHLLGCSVDGRHWVQQRALDKPDDPGLWDTLVGGMVAAGESGACALERESLEEACLPLAQLLQLRSGGEVVTRRPSAGTSGGYTIERVEWYRCTVPEAVRPENRDGEVAQFRQMSAAELCRRLQAGEFTVDAALMYVALAASGS